MQFSILGMWKWYHLSVEGNYERSSISLKNGIEKGQGMDLWVIRSIDFDFFLVPMAGLKAQAPRSDFLSEFANLIMEHVQVSEEKLKGWGRGGCSFSPHRKNVAPFPFKEETGRFKQRKHN